MAQVISLLNVNFIDRNLFIYIEVRLKKIITFTYLVPNTKITLLDVMKNRIDFLDGLRGFALLLVLFFHAFTRWANRIPGGEIYSEYSVFKYGFLGVQVFFLISGFVILMTLEKYKSFITFIYKRWLRLFPGMLMATLFVFLTASFLHERPAGQPQLWNAIPGLLFIEPYWLTMLSGHEFRPIEGAFWSLFVEFKFYFIIGILYYSIGKNKALLALFGLFILHIFGQLTDIRLIQIFTEWLSLVHFGWFVAGSLAYLYFKNKNKFNLILSFGISLIEIYQYNSNLQLMLYALIFILLFYLPIVFNRLRFLYSNPFLLMLGFISYPLYLIHENAMIAMMIKLHTSFAIPISLLPILPLLVLSIISYGIAKYIEPFLRFKIDNIKTNYFKY